METEEFQAADVRDLLPPEDIHFTMTTYIQRLHQAVKQKKNGVVVGLDPRFDDLPEGLRKRYDGGTSDLSKRAQAFEEFCLKIIDVVAPLVPAVKPQAAFFEELGPAGSMVLARVIRAARKAGLLVICDAKRGDIGSTAEAYARGYLAGSDPDAAPWGADALTVNPYMGRDTLEPFIKTAVERGGAIYVLVRTSNPGAVDFQDQVSNGEMLYRHVARGIEELSQSVRGSDPFGAVGGVVGATYPRELEELRSLMPHVPFLIPGYGSQGGAGADVASGFTGEGLGALVNSSRGIIFAHRRKPYAELFGAARWEEAVQAATREMIQDLATHTPCGNLVNTRHHG